MVGRVYLITNIITQDVYVGQTIKSLKSRFREHKYYADKYNSSARLHRAMRKYGTDKFVIHLLAMVECDDDVEFRKRLNEKEMMHIRLLKVKNTLYNETVGGEGCHGRKLSIETRKKLSDRQTGFIRSKEFLEKMEKTRANKILVSREEGRLIRKGKQVDQFELDGTYIRTFDSIAHAAEAVGTHASSISNCCLGKRNVCSSGGYIWRYSIC